MLLQSEEELLAKQTSELAGEKAAPKPKKMVGKMKVQGKVKCRLHIASLQVVGYKSFLNYIVFCAVRKVKMALDPPTGCSITSYRPSLVKMETIKYHFSNFQSTVSSGWQALRKIRFVHRMPANGSFSRQSLAYVHAGTRYIKQVSGLLKTGVTTLRNSSSSYEVAQGIKLKQIPASGGTFSRFPRNYVLILLLDNFSFCLSFLTHACYCHQKRTLVI